MLVISQQSVLLVYKTGVHRENHLTAEKHALIIRTGITPIEPIAPNWARAGVIYSRLSKYTQQHTSTGLTENGIVPRTSYTLTQV